MLFVRNHLIRKEDSKKRKLRNSRAEMGDPKVGCKIDRLPGPDSSDFSV